MCRVWSFLSSKKAPLEGEEDAGKCRGWLMPVSLPLTPGRWSPKPVSPDQSPVLTYLDAHITTSGLCDHIHPRVSDPLCQFNPAGLGSLAVSSKHICY